MAVEREVKFKLNSLPKEAFHGERISQVYILNNRLFELRARKTSRNTLTFKSKSSSLKRIEIELTPPKFFFDFFWGKGKRKIDKTRYRIIASGEVWEIDLFDSGLIIAECEFTKKRPTCPWPGVDVTDDPKFYNSNL